MMASWWISLARSTANMQVPPIIQHRHHFTARVAKVLIYLITKNQLHFVHFRADLNISIDGPS